MTATESRPATMGGFAETVIGWRRSHGRHDLPWQRDASPYRVWVSEIMLQQTRVGTVIPYFLRFMERFPDMATLAAADIDQVLHLWTGLGYYARARNLHRTARCIVTQRQGKFPDTLEELMQLSGVGRSTAGAILALAHGLPAPILDGNVKRVLARCYAVEGYPGNSDTAARLWALAEQLVPVDAANPGQARFAPATSRMPAMQALGERIAAYTQGMMDLGATVCTRTNPACCRCPLAYRCLANLHGEVERYPGKKPPRTLPVRQVVMFILEDEDGRILLEKRPPNGIWGSLYSLPQVETQDNPDHANHGTPINVIENLNLPGSLSALQIANEQPIELSQIRHSFTHFHLDITPVRYKVSQSTAAVADSNRWLWYAIANPAEVGLAAPVRKLLAALARSGNQERS